MQTKARLPKKMRLLVEHVNDRTGRLATSLYTKAHGLQTPRPWDAEPRVGASASDAAIRRFLVVDVGFGEQQFLNLSS